MKRRLAEKIVKYRIPILVFMLLLAVASALCINRTKINYDLTRYLSDDTMTKRALNVMEREFGSSEQIRLMLSDADDETLQKCLALLNGRPEVLAATHDPEKDIRQEGETRLSLITLTLNECDSTTFVKELRQLFPDAGRYYVGGSAAAELDVQNSVGEEMPLVMLIAVAVVLAVLLLTSHSWLEPAVILFTLGISIVINLGTHFIFSDVSFITFAVSAILQLALSIDYAIMLLHTYNSLRDELRDSVQAMTGALEECFMRIFSSALTTVAGLLSLLFMSFTIGFDIGLALSKGIMISMLSVFTVMPAVTLIFDKPLSRARHKPLSFGGDRLARVIYRYRRPVCAVLLIAVAAGAVLQNFNVYTFSGGYEKGDSLEIDRVFGKTSPLALLIPGGYEDSDYDTQRALSDSLMSIEVDGTRVVSSVTAMVTTGSEALKYCTAANVAALTGLPEWQVNIFFAMQGFKDSVRADRLIEAADSLNLQSDTTDVLRDALNQANAAFHGEHYDRMIVELTLSEEDERLDEAIEGILAALEKYYDGDFYVTGMLMSTYDIGNAFRGDLLKVNLITFLAIFFIVALSFRSARVPLILVFVIEGSIWISMGISRVLGSPVFFISYLICVSIQMGACIDYAILLSAQYISERAAGHDVKRALEETLSRALPTVLTSGVILVTAGYIIGKMCSVFYISDIGLLLSRGALISVILVLTLLPALLAIFDKRISGRVPKQRQQY